MEITIEEYYRLLKAHDWYYEFSDDHRVWKEGQRKSDYLRKVADLKSDLGDNSFSSLLKSFQDWYFASVSEARSIPMPSLT